MGMWQGIYKGMKDIEARKQSEEDRELARRRLELAEEQFNQSSRLQRIELLNKVKGRFGSATTTKRTGGVSDENATRYSNVLTQRFGVDAETVAKVYTNGGIEGLQSAVEIAEDYDNKFRTGKYSGAPVEKAVGQMLNNAIITAPEQRTYDWESIEAELGIQFDEVDRELLGSGYTIPGAVDFTRPTLVEKPTFTELDQADKRAVSVAEAASRDEIVRINTRVAELNKKSTSSGLTSVEEQELDWLTRRGPLVSQAQEAYKNDSFTPLIELYGAEYYNTVTEFYPNLEGAPLNPALTTAAEKEVTVPNRSVAAKLFMSGILREGMRVRNLETGKLIPIGG